MHTAPTPHTPHLESPPKGPSLSDISRLHREKPPTQSLSSPLRAKFHGGRSHTQLDCALRGPHDTQGQPGNHPLSSHHGTKGLRKEGSSTCHHGTNLRNDVLSERSQAQKDLHDPLG